MSASHDHVISHMTNHMTTPQDESAQLEMVNQYRGRLLLGLMFQLNEEPPRPPPPPGKNRKPPRRKGVLHIGIRRAEDLPKMDASGLTNAVVKCYLLPSRTSSNKRKTQVHNTIYCAIAQWFEVCLCLVLCCRFEPLPAELPW